jgi:two-component system, NarL family, response regulator NreC
MLMSKIRLLLVDDHEIVRAGLRMLFLAEPDMTIVGEAGNGQEALRLVDELKPDVVLMDVAMPGMTGIEATRQIKEAHPDTAILALTMYEDEQYFFEMLHAGASGYIPKRAAPDDLVSAIRVVSTGNVFLYASLAQYLVNEVLSQPGNSVIDSDTEDLTTREREVLIYIAEGNTNREIAEKLVISPKTVDRHRENIMRKLNMHNRVELVKYAIEKGLISVN